MEPFELLARVAHEFDQMEIEYFVTGSMATIFFGEPRLTSDVDVVAKLALNSLPNFADAFPSSDFYCSQPMIEDAVRRRKQFNIIHPTSGLKVDVIVTDGSAFDRSRFSRRTSFEVEDGRPVWFSTPEDVILKKLVFFEEGNSEKHIRDILGVLKVQQNSIDFDYLARWATELNLLDLWQDVLARAKCVDTD